MTGAALLSRYSEIRSRLMGPTKIMLRRGRALDATLYEKPIGPKKPKPARVIYQDWTPPEEVWSAMCEVAEAMDITVHDIISYTRTAHFTRARAMVVHRLRKQGLSLSQIGKSMGGRDHSSAFNLLKAYDENGNRTRPDMRAERWAS